MTPLGSPATANGDLQPFQAFSSTREGRDKAEYSLAKLHIKELQPQHQQHKAEDPWCCHGTDGF